MSHVERAGFTEIFGLDQFIHNCPHKNFVLLAAAPGMHEEGNFPR